jgi:hypothetical protein
MQFVIEQDNDSQDSVGASSATSGPSSRFPL